MHPKRTVNNDDSNKPRKRNKKPSNEVQINKSLALLGFVSWYDLEPGMLINYIKLRYE